VNNPDITPVTTTHVWPEIRPLGDEVIAHPISPAAKFEPEMVTRVPAPPEDGDSEIVGFTWNGADLKVPLGVVVTFTLDMPGTDPLLTVKEPSTTPPLTVQVIEPMMSGTAVIEQGDTSPTGKPVACTDTTVPTGP
jgi:hypothetical protein